MSNSGFEDVRTTVADSINKRFETNFSENNIIMTVGAASALNIIFKSILNPDDEVIVFAPSFTIWIYNKGIVIIFSQIWYFYIIIY